MSPDLIYNCININQLEMVFREDYIKEFEAAFGGPDVNVNGMKAKL